MPVQRCRLKGALSAISEPDQLTIPRDRGRSQVEKLSLSIRMKSVQFATGVATILASLIIGLAEATDEERVSYTNALLIWLLF